jgi:tetratricopeptide (TPR) repeat protein
VALAPDNLHARLSYADTLQRLRRHDQALAQVEEVLARDPKLIAALQRRAHLQQLRGNFSAAQEAWIAIADHPAVPVRDRTQALSSAADLALRTGQHGQAVTLLDSLERAGPDYTLYFRRGLAHDTLGNAAKASADYKKALELAPDTGQRVRLLDALARISQQRGDAAQARQHFEQAMVLDPRNVVRTRTLLQEAQRAGARDAAERWSRHLVDLTHSASDREYLANLLYARQRYNEAAEEYLKVATATQDRRLRHSAYLAMGNALAAAKRPDGAVRAFADAARLKPDRRTLEALLNAQQVSGQHAESIGTLGQLLRVSPSDERRQQFAQLLEAHGRPAEAARELKHLTSNGSTLATRRGAWRQLGYLQERMGDLRAARAAYAGWIEVAPRDPQAHRAAAEMSLKLGESRDAARRFESAAQLAPSVEILRRLVDVHTELGDLTRATEAWSRMTGLREATAEQRAEAFERLANLHAASGQPIESIMAFRAAIELGRDTSATRKGLAYALFGQSRWEEALVQFETLAAREPSADVALHRSRSLKALGRHDESARVLDQLAATLDPATGGALLRSVHVELGHLYLAQKRPVRAIQAWERALAIEPGADLALRLAAAQLEAGRVDAAERSLALTERAAFKPPESALRDDLRARVLAERQQWAQARETLARAQSVEPSADRAYRLGRIAQELRQPEMAVEQYRAADALKPDPLFAESMGYVLYAQERFQEAAQAFDTAIARDPERTRLFRDQAYAHMRSNDNEGALRAFHRAIEHREAELGLAPAARATVPETASATDAAAVRASSAPAPAPAQAQAQAPAPAQAPAQAPAGAGRTA